MKEQLLDDMALERERGITIKAHPVSMRYKHNGTEYELNLIDTPGHVDFHYEVSRSLLCCEGAVLLVDAFQGVEAQTVANAHAATQHDLDDRAGDQQDRPHPRARRRSEGGDGAHAGDHWRTKSSAAAQNGAELRAGAYGGDRSRAGAAGRSGRRAAGDGLRLGLRRVPRRGDLRAHHERDGAQGSADQVPAGRHNARRDRAGPVHAASRRRASSSPPGKSDT